MFNDVDTIIASALNNVAPENVMQRSLCRSGSRLEVTDVNGDQHHFVLSDFHRIYLLGAGKAVCGMASAVLDRLSDRITAGAIISNQDCEPLPGNITVHRGLHPLPGRRNLTAAANLLSFADSADADDLIIFLLSGGASSLLCCPRPPATIGLVKHLTNKLTQYGADITELNQVRTALSRVKGGRLAERASPARILSLIISDVPGDALAFIGSGPTAKPFAGADPAAIVKKYGLYETLAPDVQELLLLQQPVRAPDNADNLIICSNSTALGAAAETAAQLGFDVTILNRQVTGNVSDASRFFVKKITEIRSRKTSTKTCIISGGETTVNVTGTGSGGRNQELALRVLQTAGCLRQVTFASIGTDGIDGSSNAAGAYIDQTIAAKAHTAGLDPEKFLENSDANTFFQQAGGLIHTGHTGTNVMDMHIILYYPA